MTLLLIICAWLLLLTFVAGLCAAAGAGDRTQARQRRVAGEHNGGSGTVEPLVIRAREPLVITARDARPAMGAEHRRTGNVAA